MERAETTRPGEAGVQRSGSKARQALQFLYSLFVARDVEPQVHGVGYDEFGLGHLVEHVGLEGRGDVGQQDERRSLVGGGQMRRKVLEDSQLGQERAAVVHVRFVFAGPVKSLSRFDLESLAINLAPAVELGGAAGAIGARN